MINPFFDPSGMTDKELSEKINEVSMRISAMRSINMEYELIKSMYGIIDCCHEELNTRQAKKEMESNKKKGDNTVFNLEDYLGSGEKKKVESSRKQIYKPGW